MPRGQRKYNDEFKNTILSCITMVKVYQSFQANMASQNLQYQVG